MQKLLSFFLVLFIFSSVQLKAQTQEEIQQLLNGSSGTTEKSEKTKKEKEPKVTEEKVKVEKTVKEEKAKTEKAVKETKEQAEKTAKEKKEKVEKETSAKVKAEKTKKEKSVKEEKVAAEKTAKEKKNKVEKTAKANKEKAEKSAKAKKTETESEILAKYKAKKLQKIGDALYDKGSYYNAVDYYETALSKTKKAKKQSYLNYMSGMANFKLRDYKHAKKNFVNARITDKKNKYALSTYYLANSQKHLAEYDEAKKTYLEFIDNNENNGKLDFERSRARLELKGCDYAMEYVNDEPAYGVSNAGENINGPFSDFGPEMRGDELVFSKIKSNEAIELNGEQSEDSYSKIYSSGLYKDGYTVSKLFSSQLNGQAIYVGNPSFTNDGKKMFYTQCQLDDAKVGACQIYQSTLEDGVWTKPAVLSNAVNEAGAYTSQPQVALDADGNTVLYFVSERAKGRGGKDIYVAKMNEDGSFENAKNVGSPINTRYDELSPYYDSQTNTLYYSTDGELSFGGFDIYKTTLEEGEWTEPANMGKPLNSSLDDYDFVLNNSGDLGYLVSNRIGTTSLRSETCCDDIFEVRSTKVELFVAGVVYAENASDRVLANDAKVTLLNKTTGEEQDVIFKSAEYVFKLNKNEDYALKAIYPKFQQASVDFNTMNIKKSDTLHYDLFLNERNDLKDLRIGTIYYEFDMSRLRSDAPDTLKNVLLILKSYPKTQVEVSSHTDSKGTDEYNMDLSKFRTESVANYLVQEGVARERIIEKWYGESQPAAPNNNSDGSDNEEGRALNRRTEFKIVGNIEDAIK